MSLGNAADISLGKARDLLDEARTLLALGLDPLALTTVLPVTWANAASARSPGLPV